MIDERTAQEIAELKDAVEKLLRRTEFLNERLSKLEQKIGAAENLEVPRENVGVKNPPSAQIPTPQNKISMVDEYNSISNQGISESRDSFASKHKVVALTCTNAAERLNNMMLAPKFERAASVNSGEYWAVPLRENLYAVVPNIRVYTQSLHFVRAMGVIFKSNFESGTVHDKIFVQRPAIFAFDGSIWKFVQAGELRLG